MKNLILVLIAILAGLATFFGGEKDDTAPFYYRVGGIEYRSGVQKEFLTSEEVEEYKALQRELRRAFWPSQKAVERHAFFKAKEKAGRELKLMERYGALEPQITYQWVGSALYRSWPEYGQERKEMCLPLTGGRSSRTACNWTSTFKEQVQ